MKGKFVDILHEFGTIYMRHLEYLLRIRFTIMFFITTFPGKPCELPAEWEGRWFEYGEREAISVSKWNVTHKGVCKFMDTNTYGDKYIFYEK